jgi:hypothetical protein
MVLRMIPMAKKPTVKPTLRAAERLTRYVINVFT